MRYAGSGIKGLGSGIISHGIGISSVLRYQGSGCSIFVGSGTKICHAFGIRDHKFEYKNGISNEKNIPHYDPVLHLYVTSTPRMDVSCFSFPQF